MKRAVHRAQRPPDAPAQQCQLLLTASAQRLAHRPVQLVADELGEPHLRVLFIGHAPVHEEHVESLREQELDERAASAQVEDLRPVDQREHEQDRNRVLAVGSIGSGRASSRDASRRPRAASDRSPRPGSSGSRLRTRMWHAEGGPASRSCSRRFLLRLGPAGGRRRRETRSRTARAQARRAAPPPPAGGARACPRFDEAAGASRVTSARPARRRFRSTRSPKSEPILAIAATFSALRASSTPKLGLETSSSNACAVRDSVCSYSARTCSSGDGGVRSAIAPIPPGLGQPRPSVRARPSPSGLEAS